MHYIHRQLQQLQNTNSKPKHSISIYISSHQMSAQDQAIPRQDLYRCPKIPHAGGERSNAWRTRTEYGHILLNLIPPFCIFVSSIALNKEEEERVTQIK
jgi:hypothetical protein